MKERAIIVKMIFGSHLYGTNTPDSDMDYKGVFLPTKDEILLGRIPKNFSETTGNDRSKNTKNDEDSELFSLHEFIKLACEGQTVALDMLHARDNMILEKSEIWDQIILNREKFYTKNLKAFVGYARRQATKYGVKGSRLDAANEVKEIMERTIRWGVATKLEEVWDKLPVNEHCHFIEDSPNGVKQYQVCGKTLQSKESLEHALEIVNKFYNSYGSRAKMASENKGIDWKAVSHAIRAAHQVEELFTKRTITFPLTNAYFIRSIKCGELDYQTKVGPYLDGMMEKVERLSEENTLPDQPDRKFWDDFIKETVENYVFK